MIIYGGQSPVDYLGDVWSLSLEARRRVEPDLPGRAQAGIRRVLQSMVLSPADNQVVIFGGYYDSFLNDVSVMAFTPVPWWFPNPGHGTPPSARGRTCRVFDPVRNRMLVIGGFGDAMMNDDGGVRATGIGHVAAAHGGGRSHAGAASGGVGSTIRCGIACCDLRGRRRPVLNVCGRSISRGDPTWEQLHPAGGGPSPRREHTADLRSGRRPHDHLRRVRRRSPAPRRCLGAQPCREPLVESAGLEPPSPSAHAVARWRCTTRR